MLDCLRNIVGVLKENNTAITAGLDGATITALTTSTSGLFLDELPGGVHMKALKFTDAVKPFATIATGSIDLAAKVLEDDLKVALNERYKKARKNYQGMIGRMSYATTLTPAGRWQGLHLAPVEVMDGVLTVTRLIVILSGSATFKLRLFEVVAGTNSATQIKDFDVTAIGNQYFTIELTGADVLNLPTQRNGEAIEYYFLYDLDEVGPGIFPKDTKVDCTTCGTRSALYDYLEVSGVGLNDLTNLTAKNASDYSRGISLDISITCNTGALFCREYKEDDAIAVTMAHAVWNKAGELLIEEVLKSPDVNRYTTQAREYLWGKRNHFKSEYQTRVKYIAATIDVNQSNCFVCRETANQPTKGYILS